MMLEFWYEFASTYSYPAAMRVAEVAAQEGVEVRWRPFLLGPIFQDQGWDTSPFNLQPVKGAYMWRDLERICESLDLPFERPADFPQNGLHAARIALALPDDGQRAAFSRSVYRAQFAEGKPIADKAVLRDLVDRLGADTSQILEMSLTAKIKEALRAATDEARANGIFGAPTWRTSDGEIFWGNDRLEDAIAWSKH